MRTLVSMVERWSQLGEPTPRAQLAQIRGFLDLCMMDRAWTRLQAFPDIEPFRQERAALTARMFFARGWPRRARRVLDEALALWPDDADLRALASSAEGVERRAPIQDPDPDLPLAEQLVVAEAWLCTGAYHKANRLLEQLHRRFAAERRPADLLWALRGEYDLQGTTLALLAGSYGGNALSEPGDLPDDPEPTDSVPLGHRRPLASLDSMDAGGGAFPDLFGSRKPAPLSDDAGLDTKDDETAEITQATRLTDLDLGVPPEPLEDREEDTQVLRVVSSRRMDAPARQRDEGPSTAPGIRDEMEREDEAVVLLTRPADRQPPQEIKRAPTLPDPGPRRGPTPVVSKPAPLPPPPADEPSAEPLPAWLAPAAVGLAMIGLVLGGLAAWTAGMLG